MIILSISTFEAYSNEGIFHFFIHSYKTKSSNSKKNIRKNLPEKAILNKSKVLITS